MHRRNVGCKNKRIRLEHRHHRHAHHSLPGPARQHDRSETGSRPFIADQRLRRLYLVIAYHQRLPASAPVKQIDFERISVAQRRFILYRPPKLQKLLLDRPAVKHSQPESEAFAGFGNQVLRHSFGSCKLAVNKWRFGNQQKEFIAHIGPGSGLSFAGRGVRSPGGGIDSTGVPVHSAGIRSRDRLCAHQPNLAEPPHGFQNPFGHRLRNRKPGQVFEYSGNTPGRKTGARRIPQGQRRNAIRMQMFRRLFQLRKRNQGRTGFRGARSVHVKENSPVSLDNQRIRRVVRHNSLLYRPANTSATRFGHTH
ncbi:MAG: hypothetical protein BWY39_01835 [Spirochaetes bacterium ADurb.Bin269]|nr:MAG: hypothetical protein BWY39_01835 [Spirochaetes bacterium ADurb.Bin269]